MKIPLLPLVLLLLCLAFPRPASAQTETILHNFQQLVTPNDGSQSQANLVQASDGNFYGTTSFGGSADGGTVFKMTTTGTITILHSFQDGSVANDGYDPAAGLVVGADGALYGTALGGGSASAGVAFRITTAGKLTILHSFGDGSVTGDGMYPRAALVLGTTHNFYGTTYLGGTAGYGAIFQMTPTGTVTIIHPFAGSSSNDGSFPASPLIVGKDGNLYGTTYTGGGGSGQGTVFKISATGTESVVYTFANNKPGDGANPLAGVIQATDGNLYGTTEAGGSASFGTAFKVTTSGSETVIHSFGSGTPAGDGGYPEAGLTQGKDGNLYGTTYSGATGAYGTVFSMTLTGTETILHSFGNGAVANDGYAAPSSIVQGKDGNFYGTTYLGGSANSGATFQITTTGTYTLLHSFSATVTPGDGANPHATLATRGGSFYGTTANGGPFGVGNVFGFTPAGLVTTLHTFTGVDGSTDGAVSFANLVTGPNGNLYGTTSAGGTEGVGTIFEVSTAGRISVIHNFGDSKVPNDGGVPSAGLVLATDGNFYGTTSAGGSMGLGTIFKATPNGAVTIVHSFGDGSVPQEGVSPTTNLIQAHNGDFYGTTYGGGVDNDGTIYQMTPTGKVSIVYSFGQATSDGLNPNSGLIRASDNNLYGTTANGGTAGKGTAFRLKSYTTVAILHNFGDNSVTHDGLNPDSGFTQLIDGNLAGTTPAGGSAARGTVYEMTLSGTVTLLHSFGDGTVASDGKYPQAGLVEDPLGVLYGTTFNGGTTVKTTDSGTIFALVKPAQTLDFPGFSTHYVNHPPFAAYATSSSGGPVTFKIISGPATISGKTVTLTGQVGMVEIEATEVGGPHFAPVKATQYFRVELVPQTIDFPTIPAKMFPASPPFTVSATASSGLPVTFSITSGPATISGNTIVLTGTGNVTVQATQPGNAEYQPATTSQTFTVTAG